MKKLIAITIFSLCSIAFTYAEDIRNKVIKGGEVPQNPQCIKLDQSIFGFNLGTSEDDLIKNLGKPKVYIRLNARNTAMAFDDTKAYIFTDHKLSGVKISHGIINHNLKNHFAVQRGYQEQKWELDNGITARMSLADVKELLGDKLKSDLPFQSKHAQYFLTPKCKVYLYFSHYVDAGDSDDAYQLGSLMIVAR